MSEVPEPPSAEAALRAANARWRRVLEDQAEMHRATETRLRAEQAAEREARRVAEQRLAEQGEELAAEREARRALELRLAELERRLGMHSGNSSTPPSKESIAAKAKRKAARQASQRERSKDRKPGGQKGRVGRGLEPTADPDRTEEAPPPAECASCRADLAGARDAGTAWAQVWDTPPVALEKVEHLLPRRRCACCGKVTTAVVPFARPGVVTYGDGVVPLS